MKISNLFIRFYKSFNYDHQRKLDETYSPSPWDYVDDLSYPHVCINLDPNITTIVGSNESGKSHLLSAIEKVLGQKELEAIDFCRHSHFFSVERGTNKWPSIGLEFNEFDDVNSKKLATILNLENSVEKFWFFREGPEKYFCYYSNAELDKHLRELSADDVTQLRSEILPKSFRINSNIGLPSTVPIAYLANPDDETSLKLSSTEKRAAALNNLPDLTGFDLSSAQKASEQSATLIPRLFPFVKAIAAAPSSREEAVMSYKLARNLLVNVANVEPSKLVELAEAMAKGQNGHAEGLVDEMNYQLENKLNFPKWWVQDKEFELSLDLRDADLVFLISDKTGTSFTFDERSQGLRYFLSYFVQYKSHNSKAKTQEILLMDEPDAYLSADAQEDLLKIFHSFAYPQEEGKRPTQVLHVTHSPFLLDKNHSERIRVLNKGREREGTNVISRLAHNRYEPLRSAFGSFVGETAFVGNCNIVVEGPADQILLAGVSSLLSAVGGVPEKRILDLNTVTIVPACGAEHVPYLVYQIRGKDLFKPPVVVLVDSDKAGDDAVKFLKKGGERRKELLSSKYILQIGDIQNAVPESIAKPEMEDMIPCDLAAFAMTLYFKELSSFRSETAPKITANQIEEKLDNGLNLFDALTAAVSDLDPEKNWSPEKVGFAKCVIEACQIIQNSSDSIDDKLKSSYEVFLTRLQKVFFDLNNARINAEREASGDEIEKKLDRLYRGFAKDHPVSASSDAARFVLSDILEILDNTEASDKIRLKIQKMSRGFGLDSELTETIHEHSKFLEELSSLKYEARA